MCTALHGRLKGRGQRGDSRCHRSLISLWSHEKEVGVIHLENFLLKKCRLFVSDSQFLTQLCVLQGCIMYVVLCDFKFFLFYMFFNKFEHTHPTLICSLTIDSTTTCNKVNMIDTPENTMENSTF